MSAARGRRLANSISARWWAVAEPPWRRRACVGARWPGHVVTHAGWLTSGPSTASYIIKDFQTSNFEIQKCDFPMSKIHQTSQGDSLKYKEQLYLLGQLQVPSGFHVINSGINLNLNLT
jgi:hypothetical protein